MVRPTNGKQAAWKEYADLFDESEEHDNEPVIVPIFPSAGFVPRNILVVSARAARALGGIGTPKDITKARSYMLEERAKRYH